MSRFPDVVLTALVHTWPFDDLRILNNCTRCLRSGNDRPALVMDSRGAASRTYPGRADDPGLDE
jgi:hypothetical protein